MSYVLFLMPKASGAKNISLFLSEGLSEITATLIQFERVLAAEYGLILKALLGLGVVSVFYRRSELQLLMGELLHCCVEGSNDNPRHIETRTQAWQCVYMISASIDRTTSIQGHSFARWRLNISCIRVISIGNGLMLQR